MSKIETVTLINRGEDVKDLGEWTVDGEKYHFILGSCLDREVYAKAKAAKKKGPYFPEVIMPKSVFEHMRIESPALKYWMDDANGGEIYLKAA